MWAIYSLVTKFDYHLQGLIKDMLLIDSNFIFFNYLVDRQFWTSIRTSGDRSQKLYYCYLIPELQGPVPLWIFFKYISSFYVLYVLELSVIFHIDNISKNDDFDNIDNFEVPEEQSGVNIVDIGEGDEKYDSELVIM